MACPASPPHYQRDPIATVKTAFLGAVPRTYRHALLRACDLFPDFSFVPTLPQVCFISWSLLASATRCFCRRLPARQGILNRLWHFALAFCICNLHFAFCICTSNLHFAFALSAYLFVAVTSLCASAYTRSGIRGSSRAPAARDVLGSRELHWHQSVLRRGQACG